MKRDHVATYTSTLISSTDSVVGVEYMFAENSDDFFCHNEECRQQHPGM
jgi:hypothetical protein